MTTVAAIADAAFDAVAAAITDAIQDVTITTVTQGAYSVSVGGYVETTASVTGRGVLDTVKPAKTVFPQWEVGPKDQLWLLEGFTSVKEGDRMTVGSDAYRISTAQDIVGAGVLFYAIAQVLP